MGLRFRRSICLGRGLRVNLSKSGTSLSVGRRGATLNVGKRGMRATVGLPGSGLSHSETKPWHQRDVGHRSGPRPAERPSRRGVDPVVRIVVLAIAIGVVAFLIR